MPAVPSWLIEPVWDQFQALIPPVVDTHPRGCHRPRIPDRVIFDKLVQVLVFGAAYAKIADHTCSATTIRTRRDEWITAGIFEALEQICLQPTTGSSAWTWTMSPSRLQEAGPPLGHSPPADDHDLFVQLLTCGAR